MDSGGICRQLSWLDRRWRKEAPAAVFASAAAAQVAKELALQGQGARAALLPMRRTGLVGNARKSDGPRDLSRLQSSARPSCAFSEADPRPDKVDRQQDSSTGRAGRFCGTYLTLGAFWEKMSQLAPGGGHQIAVNYITVWTSCQQPPRPSAASARMMGISTGHYGPSGL